MKGINRIVAVAGLVCAVFSFVLSGTASAEIKFGILPRLSAVELTTMYTPLAEYLSKEVGEKVTLVIPKDFDAYKTMVENGQVDMGFSNSIVYVQLKKTVNIDTMAVSAEKKAGTKFRGIIITRNDSGIEKVQDLKGKKLIFVDKDSAAGYTFQMLLLTKAGMDVNKDFTMLPFAKKHDNVTMAVFNKAADAGGIREDDLDKMKDKVDLSQIKIVGYTDYFPNWPVYSTPKLNKAASAKVKAALLNLKPGDPAAEKILEAAKLSGFAPITDKDYDLLRQAAKVIGVF
jgi:phosphonate transport system substrate-binding protein